MTRTPLYGHTSADTAYLVADYPYALRLVTEYPGATWSTEWWSLRAWATVKAHTTRQLIRGERWFTVNGVRQDYTDAQIAEMAVEAAAWEATSLKLGATK